VSSSGMHDNELCEMLLYNNRVKRQEASPEHQLVL
jgi:hypothetical protein